MYKLKIPPPSFLDEKSSVGSVAFNQICFISPKVSKDKELFVLNKKYALEYAKTCEKFKDAPEDVLGLAVVKLVQRFNKEEIDYAKKHSINYIKSKQLPLKDAEAAYELMQKVLAFHQRAKKEKVFENNLDKISFNGKKIALTDAQRSECHFQIHSHSLVCAGITAAAGELSAWGADVPALCCVEMRMFKELADNLKADKSAAFLHASRHMFSAGMAGASVVKAVTSWAAILGHPVAAVATAGTANVPISAGLRAANGFLSGVMCENMGWAFVRDFENGKMLPKIKAKELGAAVVFTFLLKEFNTNLDLEKPAAALQESLAKALGFSLFENVPEGAGAFIEAAGQFVNSNAIGYAAQGIELITPAIAANFVENGGKFNSKSVEQIVKGSLFSIVCADMLGPDTLNGKEVTEGVKKLVVLMGQDKQIQEMLDSEFARRGLLKAGEFVLNKETVKMLESFYNELVPKVLEIAKTMGGLK